MTSIRAFIALELPAAVTAELTAWQTRLKKLLPSRLVRWTRPENSHLTLVFLGDGVQPAQVEEVKSVLDRVATAVPPFSLQLAQLDAFPKRRRPRVLWLGLDGEVDSLQRLKTQLDQQLTPLGWPPEARRYTPHLTLGRVNQPGRFSGAGLPWEESGEPLSWPVTRLALYHSQLTPQGARYTVLHAASLRKG